MASLARIFHPLRHEPLDELELLGIAAALIAAMLVVRYGLPAAGMDGVPRVAAAVPVFVLAVGPFLLRRARRGGDSR